MPAARTPKRPTDTRARIIQRSILLFNQKSIQTVSAKQIARHLKISPGNLTYYFPKKLDLLRATLEVLRKELQVAFVRPAVAQLPRDAVAYMTQAFEAVWNFRFFFNSLTYVLRADAQLHREYRAFHEWLMEAMESDLIALDRQGYFIRRPAPNNYRWLAENIWNVWLTWLRTAQIDNHHAPSPTKESLHDALVHHWSLLEPWMEPKFSRNLLKAFNQLHNGEPKESRGKKAKQSARRR